MDTFYSENKLKDISVAFCFICLLHLANEEGLEIEMKEKRSMGNKMDDLTIKFN